MDFSFCTKLDFRLNGPFCSYPVTTPTWQKSNKTILDFFATAPLRLVLSFLDWESDTGELSLRNDPFLFTTTTSVSGIMGLVLIRFLSTKSSQEGSRRLKNRKGTALAFFSKAWTYNASPRHKPDTALILVSADHPLRSFQAPATALAATP